jgi:DNA-binding LacI/PurR family transcriptional regulator
VRQNFVEIGNRAIAVLLAELNGNEVGDRDPIAPELILRASTAPPRR